MLHHRVIDFLAGHTELAIIIGFALGSAFCTILAGIHTYLKDARSKNTSLSNLYILFANRYIHERMYVSIKKLTDYYKQDRANFSRRWAADKARNSDTAEEMRIARRYVDRFYFDIAQLYEARHITKRFARILCAQGGINVYYKICQPMREIDPPNTEKDYYKILRRVRTKYGDGEIF